MSNGVHDAYFELAFSPCGRLVSKVRRFVEEFYAEVFADADVSERVAIATHELLENGARYSVDGQANLRIKVTSGPEAVTISIVTCNRASSENIATLRAALDELAQEPDARAHYQTLMRRSAKRTDGSGLGLGRIRAEGDMKLQYSIQDDIVTLRAEASIEPIGGAS
jgi:hypothetical protein